MRSLANNKSPPSWEGNFGRLLQASKRLRRRCSCRPALALPTLFSVTFTRGGRSLRAVHGGDSTGGRRGRGRLAKGGGRLAGAAVLPTEQLCTAVPPRTQKSEAYLPALLCCEEKWPNYSSAPRLAVSIASQCSASVSRGHRSRTRHLISDHPAAQLSSGPTCQRPGSLARRDNIFFPPEPRDDFFLL